MNDSQNAVPQAAPSYGNPRYASPSSTPDAYGGVPQAAYGAADRQPGSSFDAPLLGAPSRWSPPPRPGLMPLRPLSFGALLGTPFQVLRRNPGPTFGSALLTQVVTAIVSVVTVGGVGIAAFARIDDAAPSDRDAVTAGAWALVILSTLVPLALSILGTSLLQGVLVLDVARGTLGEKNTLGTLWKVAASRLWPLMAWFATVFGITIVALGGLVGIAVLIGSLGGAAIGIAFAFAALGGLVLTVVGVWLGTKTALVPSIIVLERRGMAAAVRRSWMLTAGSFWKTFGVLALISAILYVATQVITTPVSFIGGLAVGFLFPTGASDDAVSAIAAVAAVYGLTLLVSLVFGAIAAVVQSSAVAVIYIDLRMRREGLDLDLMRYIDAGGAAAGGADPYFAASRRTERVPS